MKTDLTSLFGLEGKRAAVTGAGGALGGTIAEALAQLGARVAILDLDLAKAKAREEAITREGGAARAFACNVTDEADLVRSYREVSALWGGVDLLVNAAGGNNPKASTDREYLEPGDVGNEEIQGFFNLPSDDFIGTFGLNFFGTFLATKVFARGMAERGAGAVLNISSMSAFTPLTKVVAYSAAKAAVANFTHWLATHLSHVGVRVNAIAPGFFMTEQLRFLHIDEKTGEYTPRAKKVVAHTPMGRYGDPVDLVSTVVWLLSDGARFVTGIVVPIDGGFSSYSI